MKSKRKHGFRFYSTLVIILAVIAGVISIPFLTSPKSILGIQDDNSHIQLKLIGSDTVLNLEVASSTEKKAQGLMNRTSLQQNTGMFFIFQDLDYRTFWMKDTFLSLDIIFLDPNLNVVSVSENTKINQTQEIYRSKFPAQYVIEVKAGWAKSVNLKPSAQFAML